MTATIINMAEFKAARDKLRADPFSSWFQFWMLWFGGAR